MDFNNSLGQAPKVPRTYPVLPAAERVADLWDPPGHVSSPQACVQQTQSHRQTEQPAPAKAGGKADLLKHAQSEGGGY